MRKFNTTAVCIPSKHYMVDLSDRVRKIKMMVDEGEYFTINRARQYGKTTTLTALKKVLVDEYIVLSLDFQGLDKDVYENGAVFSQALARLILDLNEFENLQIPDETLRALEEYNESDDGKIKMDDFFRIIKRWIKREEKPIVLIIDEVDTAANNQVFLDFLAQLRDGYIKRSTDNMPAFQSVILSGVTDIKHLRSKIREDEQHKENSPWNIAADFNIDMSLSEEGIRGMLDEYEKDHRTEMDTGAIAGLLRDYTNGYPFLVSRICELVDREICKTSSSKDAWTEWGISEAVKLLLAENNTLFQSMTAKLNNYPRLKDSLRRILMEGTNLAWNPDRNEIIQMQMYGFVRNVNNTVQIDNRIFETRLYNMFLSEEEVESNLFYREGDLGRNIFVAEGIINVRLIMEHFIQTYHQLYGSLEETFKEKDGRELFLLFLKPIINGTGNYYIEAQTRDQKRTDIIIDYLGKQYIIELKIWRGDRYNKEGEKQIIGYLDYFGLSTGYMLSFNFNKKKEIGVKRISIENKILYEGTV